MHRIAAAALTLALMITGGSAMAKDPPDIATVPQLDLQRYMGDWYVIANIPPSLEKGAINSIEHYELNKDGEVEIRFTYQKEPNGKVKTLKSKGFMQDASNANWGVQFIWPIKAEYLVPWIAPDYSQVIVARNKRDWVWFMARTPTVSEADFEAARQRIAALGYDASKLNRVTQSPR